VKLISFIATPVFDPLEFGVELPLETMLYPLGGGMHVKTNSREIIQTVQESWGGFPRLFDGPPIELRVVVSDDAQAPRATGVVWRAQGHLVALLSDHNNFAICDLPKGFAFSWLTPATARDHEFSRYFYLDTIAQLLLWQTHLTPRIHASCVARNGRGVLLCGESGAGKSCLAYACARRGWSFITDESVAVARGSRDRIALGKPRQMHFRETAAEIFPELAGRLTTRNALGKISIEVHTAELPGIHTAFQCRAAAVVFLNRNPGGGGRLVPLSAEDAFARLDRDLPLFEGPLHAENRAALRYLVDTGAFELRYHDLDEAVDLLETLVG
jgi:hypothetical protein